MKRALAGALFAIGFAQGALAAGFMPIDVRAIPIRQFLVGSDQTHFGALEFRGGLELVSRVGEFGSWSGLDFGADGTLYAVADTGLWFSARLVETNGTLTGISDTQIAPLLGDNGKPYPTKGAGDAEGLRIAHEKSGDRAVVSFEQTTRIRSYAGPTFAEATPKPVKLPKFVQGIRRNQGLESIAIAPAVGALGGATVTIAERSLDAAGNHRGFILSGPKTGTFSIRRSDELDITDAAFLPNGDLLILERRFSFSGGFALRIRRIDGSTIVPGATVDGTVLITANNGDQIDNLEGMALRTSEAGETLITLISDNNGSMLQRTILLQFALPGAAPLPPQN
jgi:hypothetical protein